MLSTKRTLITLSLILIASIILSACGAPQTVIVTQTVKEVVTQEVEVEVEVEKEVVTTKEVVVTQEVTVERDAFTTPHPILSDLRVRQAMDYCTNRLDLIKSVYPQLNEEQQAGLVMNTFIPRDHWAYAGDENVSVYDYDPEKGKQLLEEAGWILPSEDADTRVNAEGQDLLLRFTTTNASFRQTWGAVWEQQMKECGITVIRMHVPSSWWFGDTTGLARRDFELGAFAWVGEADPEGQTTWACDQIPSPANNWEGQNYMGWCNEAASTAIKVANNTLSRDERIENYTIVQQAYTEDVPALPLFNRTETFSARADLSGFDPAPGEEYYVYNIEDWEVPGSDTIVIGFTQEPASLFGPVEDGVVTHLVLMMLGLERSYTSLNYDFQPLLVEQVPTLENGGTVNQDIEVKEGDKIVDANGEVVNLEPGMMVKDASDNTVEYTGGTINMKQLVVTYDYIDDLTWSDGTPVSPADFELGWKTECDPESGATSFITCQKIQTMEYIADGLKVVQTMIPGDQYPMYFSRDYRPYPSHRVIESGDFAGMTLAEVPAKEWATLEEVAERPFSIGPYMITDWVKGEKIVLAPNPYWYGGEVSTPNIVIAIVTAENAEAQLLGGQVDLLGSETLAGLTETLVNAEAEGKVINYVTPGGTWEHVDFNLFLK